MGLFDRGELDRMLSVQLSLSCCYTCNVNVTSGLSCHAGATFYRVLQHYMLITLESCRFRR
ncbi:hypothetical protein [Pseudomonas phage PhL_UNISO_PA-DSM_ph0034]|uniref:Uncharacterized protein n=1 Tax=Pseudomonas phage PhL_UNISO_PA-DSM_ph0034 TaxID=2812900 RepID=A0A9E6Q718_9CAUD|nr:hypothetical protein QE329_gp095 [Pseudomonas phage PhL_UNISO_PA-DSM_ph0034]QYC95215.1 hypothetical protein [Pseudomonas phage PhL_UNISO_PA-DSM_ph0034]